MMGELFPAFSACAALLFLRTCWRSTGDGSAGVLSMMMAAPFFVLDLVDMMAREQCWLIESLLDEDEKVGKEEDKSKRKSTAAVIPKHKTCKQN